VIAGGIFTALGLSLLAATSTLSLPHHSSNDAQLRLSWSAMPERIEVCRTLSEDELAGLAEHMRQRVQCEGTSASYDLTVSADGNEIATAIVRGGGLRHDRPIHLLREYPVPAGHHRIQVTFARREAAMLDTPQSDDPLAPTVDTGLFAGRAAREISERARRTQAAIPALMTLDTTVSFGPRQVALVAFDSDSRRLVWRTVEPSDE
jgi:hypothetical protein